MFKYQTSGSTMSLLQQRSDLATVWYRPPSARWVSLCRHSCSFFSRCRKVEVRRRWICESSSSSLQAWGTRRSLMDLSGKREFIVMKRWKPTFLTIHTDKSSRIERPRVSMIISGVWRSKEVSFGTQALFPTWETIFLSRLLAGLDWIQSRGKTDEILQGRTGSCGSEHPERSGPRFARLQQVQGDLHWKQG